MPTSIKRKESRKLARTNIKVEQQVVRNNSILEQKQRTKDKNYYLFNIYSDRKILNLVKNLPFVLSPIILSFLPKNIVKIIQLIKFQALFKSKKYETPSDIKTTIENLLSPIPPDIIIKFSEKSGFTKYFKKYYASSFTNKTLYEYCVNHNIYVTRASVYDDVWIFRYVIKCTVLTVFERAVKTQNTVDIAVAVHLYNTILYINKKFAV